ncbi:MAG: ATP synthase F1 subunit delta [Crocinitomicaceae bacterium]|nr:ATP synthase F1 subunit delta [Crocinitomicaceae bacterium]
MKKNTKASSRYAKALLELAIENKNLDSVMGDMNFLLQMNDDSRDFELLIASPVVNSTKKNEIFEKIFEQFEQVTLSFVKLITENRRESLLPQIASSFIEQVKEYKGIVPLTLISAKELDQATKDSILAKIGNTVKGQLEVVEKIDESLIGGFVVRMGDTRIDASVSSQLNNLKQRLTR